MYLYYGLETNRLMTFNTCTRAHCKARSKKAKPKGGKKARGN